MAMIACPECSQSVSDRAFKCPNCGVQLRKPKRSFIGKLFKWTFIGFNALMAISLIWGFGSASQGYDQLSGSEQTAAAVGTGIGVMMIVSIWVIGSIILGMFVLFTRPKSS